MSSYREQSEKAKQERREPVADQQAGNRMKKKPSKAKRGDWKLRRTHLLRADLDVGIWDHYRDEATVLGALRSLGRKYAFYFFEALNPAGEVIADNREEYEKRRANRRDCRSVDEMLKLRKL